LTPTFPYSKEQGNSTLLTLAAELKSELHEAQDVLAALEEPEGGRVSVFMPFYFRQLIPSRSSLSTMQLAELRASWPKEQQEIMQEAEGMLHKVIDAKEDCVRQAYSNQQSLIDSAQFYQKKLSELSSKLRGAA